MSKFYEKPGFKKLQREWYAKLREDGFDDIEGGAEDGRLHGTTDEVQIFGAHGADMENCAAEAQNLIEATAGIRAAALDALYDEDLWPGLPEGAREWWALQVHADMTPTRAGDRVGWSRRRQVRNGPLIRAAIAARSASE